MTSVMLRICSPPLHMLSGYPNGLAIFQISKVLPQATEISTPLINTTSHLLDHPNQALVQFFSKWHD